MAYQVFPPKLEGQGKMANVFEHYAKRKDVFAEVYEVVHTAEVVVNRQFYRIEVHKGYSNPSIPYTVRYFIQDHVTVQPSYPSKGGGGFEREFERQPEDMAIWKRIDLPWVAMDSAEAALTQALMFLEQGARGQG